MSLPDHRPVPAMEGLLPPIINLDSIIGATGYLLARNPSHPHPDWIRTTARHLLGRHRQFHLLLPSCPIMGDEQPLVGN
jgi:hypothetical protein